MLREEYDTGSKIWTAIFGKWVMLVIQWVAVIAPRLAHPQRPANATWNVIALLIGFAFPVAWLVSGLRRGRIDIFWIAVIVALCIWAFVSFAIAAG